MAIVGRTGNVEKINNGGYSDPRLIDKTALMCIKMGARNGWLIQLRAADNQFLRFVIVFRADTRRIIFSPIVQHKSSLDILCTRWQTSPLRDHSSMKLFPRVERVHDETRWKILMKVNVPFHPVKLRLIITGNVLREFRREIATIFRSQLPSSLKSAFQIDAFRLLQDIKLQ